MKGLKDGLTPVSIPQAVSTVATSVEEKQAIATSMKLVSIPQAVSTVATDPVLKFSKIRLIQFQYRKR